jgi:hypothetical protein
MARNVFGLFDSIDDAQEVVRALVDAGFPREKLNYISSEVGTKDDVEHTQTDAGTAGKAAGIGAAGGAVLGGVAALAVPGIGPLLAAGAGALIGGLAGTGGIVGGLRAAGAPEEEAHVYAEGVRRGGGLVVVETDTEEEAQRAEDIMSRYNVVDIERRAEELRGSGWTGFDENTGR